MASNWHSWLAGWRPAAYGRRPALVLLNGLAEQAESWFRNARPWGRAFDVHAPNLLAYDGPALHDRIDAGLPVDVDYLAGELHAYLTRFAQTPPYHLVASSLGGKVAVEFCVRYPELIDRLVLVCPSGMGDAERLPIVEGVRRNDIQSLIDSVFFDPRRADPGLLDYYRAKFPDRRWRTGVLRTVRGTSGHAVRDLLPRVPHPTLFISGAEDRIVSPAAARSAAALLPCAEFVELPRCGHAPQIEKAAAVNRLVARFLAGPAPARRAAAREPALA